MWKFSFRNVSTFLLRINAFGIQSFLKKRTILNSNIPEGFPQNILSRDKGIVGSRNAFCLNFIYTRDLGTLWARTFFLSFDRSFNENTSSFFSFSSKWEALVYSRHITYYNLSFLFHYKTRSRHLVTITFLFRIELLFQYKDHFSDNIFMHSPTLSWSTICIYRLERQPNNRIKFSKAFLRQEDV